MAGSAGTQVAPKKPASLLPSAGRSQNAVPLPAGSLLQSEPQNEPERKVPRPSSPGPCRFPTKAIAAGFLLRRYRTAAKRAMRRFYAVYASAEMMKVLPEPGCNDPVRAQSVVRSSQARGGSPAHAGRVRPAACSLCMGLRSAWSLHIQIRPSSASGSGICNRARWRGCVSYFTLATFSGRAAATRPREGPMVRIHLPPAESRLQTRDPLS